MKERRLFVRLSGAAGSRRGPADFPARLCAMCGACLCARCATERHLFIPLAEASPHECSKDCPFWACTACKALLEVELSCIQADV